MSDPGAPSADTMARLALCSCPDAGQAQALAGILVERRLAACVSVLPQVRSVYRWQGKVERADEALLLIKTVEARLVELEAAILEHHPYELPEIIVVAVGSGLDRYLRWLHDETAP
ncbi:MAG: divalent-cation tolerance protein CutA [Lysobacteraceae bacterium]|jgi:periplasmic divalent cation tolerance protein